MDTPTRNTSLDEGLLTNVERPTSAVQAEIPMKMVGDTGTTNLLGSDVPTADVDERWFHTLRFPKFAFTNCLAHTVINPVLLPLATIMFVRLIDGLGYWDTIYITCSERTMAGYIFHLCESRRCRWPWPVCGGMGVCPAHVERTETRKNKSGASVTKGIVSLTRRCCITFFFAPRPAWGGVGHVRVLILDYRRLSPGHNSRHPSVSPCCLLGAPYPS